MQNLNHLPFSTKIAVYSFGIGTLLFLLHFVTQDAYLYIIGYFYLILAIIINGIILLFLLYKLIIYKNTRQQIFIKILILLANIPIALFYFYIIIGQPPF